MSRAIVVGAGLGGLAAAVRLRARGHRVVVLESTDQAGGRAGVVRREGHVFDTGPTVITAPYLLDELFALLGRDRRDHVELMPVDPFFRVLFPDGASFDYVGEEERILAQIARFDPRDVDGYRRMAQHARQIFDIGYTRLADQPFDQLSTMLRVAPDMVRLQNYRSVYGLVSRYIRDPRLRQVFTFQPLLIGGNPLRASSIYLLIHWIERQWGVHWVRGGTGALVAALVRLLEEAGVEVRLNSPVEQIAVADGRAVGAHLADGQFLPADRVICNADPSFVYTRMIDPQHRRRNTDGRVARVKQSMSLFVAGLATRRTWPELAHHTILLGPRYRGLLKDIFDRRVLAEDFSLYLHNPGATDASMAPPGRSTFYVLSPVPNLKAGIDWEAEGPRYRDRILAHLNAHLLPGLIQDLDFSFHITPRTYADRYRSIDGAGFGPEPTLTQSAWFRYHNRSEDVEELYFVGAGTHPGAGVPGVLCSAKVLDRLIPAAVARPRLAPGLLPQLTA